MSAPFPNPDWNNTVQVFQYVNTTLMDGYLGIGILITLWIIAYARLKLYNDNKGAFASASFALALVAVLLWAMDLVNDFALILCVFMIMAGAVMLITSKTSFE